MKRYEAVSKNTLMTRTPVIIRCDGRAFHTFTRHLNKPFDNVFMNSMIQTMETMCSGIQNCIFAYTQSDEITFVLKDYEQINTSAWFDNEVQKLCSISSSMATFYFNKFFQENAKRFITTEPNSEYSLTLLKCIEAPALFDSRAFNIPKDEVVNLIYWRQLDAVRNSILSYGQTKYTQKQLHKASCEVIKEMLRQDNTPWENLPIYKQRGTACKREEKQWITDYCMPLLLKEKREYLEELL